LWLAQSIPWMVVAIPLYLICMYQNSACSISKSHAVRLSLLPMKKKKNSILKLPTKEWHDKSGHSQRPPSRPPKRRGSGHQAEAWHPD
jgi:hypothetical protein